MALRTSRRPRSLAFASLLAVACTADPADRGGLDLDDESAGGKADDLDPDVVDAEFGLDARPSNVSCIAPAAPPSNSNITTTRVFDSLTFSSPTSMLQAPEDESQWYVVEKRGTVRAFDNVSNPTSTRTFVDIQSLVEDGPNEAGLLDIAFHPDWQDNGRVYLSFNLRSNGVLWSAVTTMTSTDGGQTLDTDTHALVFATQQPFSNHNGGQLKFGPDGLLYFGLGDGGSADDPQGNGQNTNTVLGSMLRLDVDHPSGGNAYGIPSDNPFANGGGRPEIYAWGLRNPWRFSWDTLTGEMFVADVGQDDFEEVDILVKGGNYGWDAKEAFSCFEGPCNDPSLIDPIHAYDHTQGDRSITGGFVYRGDAIPGLQGTYIFGDIITGRIWGLSRDGSGWDSELLLESGINMATFAQGHDGELYVPNYFDGTIHQIIAAGPPPSSSFPQFLSQTGCFDEDDPRFPAPGMISYSVASPLWSDGADKERYFAIPNNTAIQMQSDGDFIFPVGTVLAKTFMLGGKRIETRLMMRHPDGEWGGYAYRWNSSQTDAVLLQSSETVTAPGGQQWRIPSRADCDACHTDAANIALGPEFIQLNSDHVYPTTKRRANQMETLASIGLIAGLSADDFDADQIVRLSAIDDDDASVADRARSYLHSNCSSCHRPGGPGRSDADMRFLMPWAGQNMCNTVPETGTFGLFDARLVRPGDADNSVLVHRMESLGDARMPAIGSTVVHTEAMDVIRDWIDDMNGCP